MKVLITGGAGFIGSNLCEAFLNKKHDVVCLDNFSTGKKTNIESLLENSQFKLIKGDIRDYTTCLQSMKDVDVVLHHAALGSVPRSIKDPLSSIDVNIGGFSRVLYAAIQSNVKRFVYAASSSTYGDHKALPKVEHVIGNPLSPYAITKYTNELIAENFSTIYGIETIGFRYFNVFGKRQDPEGAYAAVIPKFIHQLISHKSPVINGDGTNSRDFTYVDNVIQINLLAANTNNIEAINQVYNVACGEQNNLNQLFYYLKEHLAVKDKEISRIEAIHGEERSGDVKHSLASIEKAKNLLGYSPTHLFNEGIKETVEWYWNSLN